MSTADVVTIGEALLRLSVPKGKRLETAPSLDVCVAGAELNVAVALARMGRSAAWLGRLPRSPFGRRVAEELTRHHVDTASIAWVDEGRVGTYYVEMAAPPRPTDVVYDRANSTGAAMSIADVDWDVLGRARAIHMTGITAAVSESCREVVMAVAEWAAGESDVTLSFDVNHRSKLWSAEQARPVVSTIAGMADLVIVNEDDAAAVLDVVGDPPTVIGELAGRFPQAAVVATFGDQGAHWAGEHGSGQAASLPVEVVDPIGAGDAFAAGVLLGLLDGDLPTGVRTGTAMAALTLGVAGDQFPFRAPDVAAVLAGRGTEVNR